MRPIGAHSGERTTPAPPAAAGPSCRRRAMLLHGPAAGAMTFAAAAYRRGRHPMAAQVALDGRGRDAVPQREQFAPNS